MDDTLCQSIFGNKIGQPEVLLRWSKQDILTWNREFGKIRVRSFGKIII